MLIELKWFCRLTNKLEMGRPTTDVTLKMWLISWESWSIVCFLHFKRKTHLIFCQNTIDKSVNQGHGQSLHLVSRKQSKHQIS